MGEGYLPTAVKRGLQTLKDIALIPPEGWRGGGSDLFALYPTSGRLPLGLPLEVRRGGGDGAGPMPVARELVPFLQLWVSLGPPSPSALESRDRRTRPTATWLQRGVDLDWGFTSPGGLLRGPLL